jgi:hypothetical protein
VTYLLLEFPARTHVEEIRTRRGADEMAALNTTTQAASQAGFCTSRLRRGLTRNDTRYKCEPLQINKLSLLIFCKGCPIVLAMWYRMLLLLLPSLLAVEPIVLSPLLSNLLFSRLCMKRKRTGRLHLLAKPPCLVNKPNLLQHLILCPQGTRKMRSRRHRHRHDRRHQQRPKTMPFLVLLL